MRYRVPRSSLRTRHGVRASWAVLLVVLFAMGCEDDAAPTQPARVYEASAPVCPPAHGETRSAGAPEAAVFPNIQVIGTAANQLVSGAGYLWVVESTSNTVSRFDPETAHFDPFFIDVGNGRNPFDALVDETSGRVYVSNWLSNTLSVAALGSGEIITEIGTGRDDFDAPQGIGLSAQHIYVANTAYRGPGDYGQGSVTVLARDSLEVLGRVVTAHPNTAFVHSIDTPDGPRIVVVNTGAIEVNQDGAFVRSEASLEIWQETENPLAPIREVFVLARTADPRMGAPGDAILAPAAQALYLTSATAPVVFKFDLARRRWQRGSDDPIVLYSSGGDEMHSATIDARGILYVSAFNQDALYLVDTACDALLAGPIQLDRTPDQLEGPQALSLVETAPGRAALYFVMTLSNAMGKVALTFD